MARGRIRSKPTPAARRDRPGRRRRSRAWGIGLAVAAAVVGAWMLVPEGPTHLRRRAEAAERAEDWSGAAEAWGRLNRSGAGDGASELAEARDLLAQGKAGRAERALERSCELEPGAKEPWLLRLELLRLEDRVVEARQVASRALGAVGPGARREVRKAATLALLAEAPDALARATLARWIAADPGDLDARVALARRVAAMPGPGDPDAAGRIRELEGWLASEPGHVEAREALVLALADAGEGARGRAVLEGWPEGVRDARYARLRGRWDLDYDHRPARAVDWLRRALEDLPNDWRTRARLARALRAAGREAEARREAEAVARMKEALDPEALGRRLTADLDRLDAADARADLADLCGLAGLADLAEGWRADAAGAAEAAASPALLRP